MKSNAPRPRAVARPGSDPSTWSVRRTPSATTALWLSCLLGGLLAASTQAQPEPANTQTVAAFSAGQRFGERLAAGDLNGDGVNELVVLSDGVVTIFYRNASGDFEAGYEENLAVDLAVAICDLVPELPGDELILGKPQNSVGAQAEAGVVQVFSVAGDPFAGGLTISGLATFDQGDANIPGNGSVFVEAGDHFGATLATGDFNHDGICDVAASAPDEDGGATLDVGSVHVFLGPVDPLNGTATFLPQIAQGSNGVGDAQEAGDHFGSVLAVGRLANSALGGDFLIVGVPDEDLGSTDTGAVWLVPFGTTEFDVDNAQQLDAATLGLTPGSNRFGASLAAGDLDGNGFEDLAIGAPNAFVAGLGSLAGFVAVVDGRSSFPLANGATQLTMLSAGVPSSQAERFGAAVAIGNFAADFFADLAIGVPNDPLGFARGITSHGSVQLFQGGSDSLAFHRSIDERDIPGEDLGQDRFGEVLVFADTLAHGTSDLLVGVPRENTAQGTGTGVVHVIPSGGRIRRAGLLVEEGDPFPDPAMRGSSGVVERIGLAYVNGTGEAVFGKSDSDGSRLVSSSDGILTTGFDIDAGGASTGASSLFSWFDRGSVAVESSLGTLAAFGAPAPDGGTYSSFNGVRADDQGTTYWLGDSPTRRLYRSHPGSGLVQTLLSQGDVVDGVTIADINFFDVSHDGSQVLAHVDPDALWLNGQLVQRDDQPFPTTGEAYFGTFNASVNRSGEFVFNGLLVGTGGPAPEIVVSSSGSTLALGDAVGPHFLEGMEARSWAINDSGAVVGVFERPGRSGLVFLACEASDLQAASAILLTGDVLDVDGDGFAELRVEALPGFAPEQPELTQDGTVLLRLGVAPLGGTEVHEALIELRTTGCSFFEDGFETGDTSVWSAAVP